MIEAKKREMSQQLAELEDGSDGPDEFEGNNICNRTCRSHLNEILLLNDKKNNVC